MKTYQISEKIVEKFYSKFVPVPMAGCWLWEYGCDKDGYGQMHISGSGNIRTAIADKAHRLSWRIHFGQIPYGMNVLHRCDVPSCVNPSHLFLGTHLDNINDRIAKGRPKPGTRGEKHLNAKLTDSDVIEIRNSYSGKYGEITAIARRYSVDPSTVNRVIHCKRWNHVGA